MTDELHAAHTVMPSAFQLGPIDGLIVRPLVLHEDSRGWLIELFRSDDSPSGFRPEMAYVSQTLPGVSRGPHEHRQQTDLFACFGPGDLRLLAWDARPESATYGNRTELVMGASNPVVVLVPPGVVHGYRNERDEPALLFNAPNQLFAGEGRREAIDEIRHEDQPDSPFSFD